MGAPSLLLAGTFNRLSTACHVSRAGQPLGIEDAGEAVQVAAGDGSPLRSRAMRPVCDRRHRHQPFC